MIIIYVKPLSNLKFGMLSTTTKYKPQGRRHGFESGGQIFGPPFLASGGQNIAFSLIRMFAL